MSIGKNMQFNFTLKKVWNIKLLLFNIFHINFVSFELLFIHQRVHTRLPDLLQYFYQEKVAPQIIVVKLYPNLQSKIHIISIQIDVESINGTIELNETNHCPHVQMLFSRKEGI